MISVHSPLSKPNVVHAAKAMHVKLNIPSDNPVVDRSRIIFHACGVKLATDAQAPIVPANVIQSMVTRRPSLQAPAGSFAPSCFSQVSFHQSNSASDANLNDRTLLPVEVEIIAVEHGDLFETVEVDNSELPIGDLDQTVAPHLLQGPVDVNQAQSIRFR